VYALTFDDGPGPSTAALLDVLAAAGVRATFFLIGRNVEEAPWCAGDVVRARGLAVRAAREGHLLGNHTYSHFRPDRWRELKADLLRGAEVVRSVRREAAVAEGPVPFRLPYGVRLVEGTMPFAAGTLNAVTVDPRLAVIASMSIGHQHWTSDFDDWTLRSATDGDKLARAMAAHVGRGGARPRRGDGPARLGDGQRQRLRAARDGRRSAPVSRRSEAARMEGLHRRAIVTVRS
jgi:chitin deacetylase